MLAGNEWIGAGIQWIDKGEEATWTRFVDPIDPPLEPPLMHSQQRCSGPCIHRGRRSARMDGTVVYQLGEVCGIGPGGEHGQVGSRRDGVPPTPAGKGHIPGEVFISEFKRLSSLSKLEYTRN